MKSNKVLKLLKITRPTLTNYVKTGKIKAVKQPNGFYDYNNDDVFKLANINIQYNSVIYARVSTQKQKQDLIDQIDTIRQFANSQGYVIDKVYQDIASGLNFTRGNFETLVDDILNRKVRRVFISNKDRLTRVSFDFWNSLFNKYDCELIVMNNDNCQSDNEEKEIFQDIISLLHCFAMKMYSSRRKKKITLIKEDLENEVGI